MAAADDQGDCDRSVLRSSFRTPAAFNSNARTSAERLYDRDPQPGMVWDRKRGWDVHARAPPVDERFLP